MIDIAERAKESEQAIIGAALVSGGMDWIPTASLEPKDFFEPLNRKVWGVILGLNAERAEVDLITVLSRMDDAHGDVKRHLMDMARNCPSSANVETYIELQRSYVRKAKALKAIIQAESKIAKARAASECDKAVDETITELMGLSRHTERYEHDPKQYLTSAVQILEDRKEGRVTSVQSGITDLDWMVGGLHDSDLIIIAGRPATGKTAVAVNMAMNCGVPVGFISGEQPAEQIALRMICIAGNVSVEKMRSIKLMNEGDWKGVFNGTAKVSSSEIYINDTPRPTLAEIQRQARKWKHEKGIKVLFIDYLQRVSGGDSKAPKHERVGEVAKELKSLARELNIPVVALAQVNRAVEQRNDKRPGMADISDSSEIEKEADLILTLYRDEVYNENSNEKGLIEFITCKNRHGGTGVVRARWRGEYMQVQNIERRYDGG